MTPLVQIQQLTKHFAVGKKILQAIQELSFSIFSGETLGVAGESGCGKSTLGKLLIRLIEATGGSIFFENRDIRHLSKKELISFRQEVQMIFQNPAGSLNPKMTIEEVLEEPFDIHNIAKGQKKKELILELLEKVGLQKIHLKRLPHELSGGQKQRVCIARALALKPRFLICDEPLSALDVSIQAQIVNLLKDLQQESGLTYLFISHDLSIMRYLANRIAIMYLGQIVELAPTEVLFNIPLHPYTKALLSAILIPNPELERKRTQIKIYGEIPSPLSLPKGCPFYTRCPLAKNICKEYKPKLRETMPGHFVACHFT